MADPTTTETEQLPELPDPAFTPPGTVQADAPPVPEETEVVEESDPPPPPPENREQMLARENAELRNLLTNFQQQQYRQPPQPTYEPNADPYAPYLRGIPEAQQGPWRESLKILDPILRDTMERVAAPLREQVRMAEGRSESLLLADKRNQRGEVQYPLYRKVAPMVEQARYQHYLNTQGREWQPLEVVYLVLDGQGAFDHLKETPKQERSRTRRAQAARVPAATTAEPQQATRMPAPRRTVESTMAMSDDAMRDLATKNGIDWPGQPTRKRVA